jgi:hypothetical protein
MTMRWLANIPFPRRLGVYRVTLNARRSLPLFLDKQTVSEPVGTLVSRQKRPSRIGLIFIRRV